MPRTTRGRGSRTSKGTTHVALGVQTRSQGSTVTGQKRGNTNPGEGPSQPKRGRGNTNPGEGPSRPKRGRAASQDTQPENDVSTAPLTQANIPQIVEAVLNNLSALHETTDADDSHKTTDADDSHTQENLGKRVTNLCI